MNYKKKFIKDYVEINEPISLQDAKQSIEALLEVLPARERNTKKIQLFIDMMKQQVNEAFEDVIETIAKCPFVHIVIDNNEEYFDFIRTMKKSNEKLALVAGYVSAIQDEERRKK